MVVVSSETYWRKSLDITPHNRGECEREKNAKQEASGYPDDRLNARHALCAGVKISCLRAVTFERFRLRMGQGIAYADGTATQSTFVIRRPRVIGTEAPELPFRITDDEEATSIVLFLQFHHDVSTRVQDTFI